MIFQVNKSAIYRSQEGITLLLSVLLLSAITTITFSLAAVGFAEIATSDDLARTEPVLYYSLGVAEEGTFGMKRTASSIKTALGTECDANFVTYTIDGAYPITTRTKVCNVNSSNDIEVIVPVSTYATATRLYVYDPANSGTGSSGYSSISFKKTTNNGGFVKLYMCQLSTDCVDPSVSSIGWNPNGLQLDYNTLQNITVSNNSYEIVLISSGAKEFVEVISQPKGLPYLNKEAIEIQSASGRLIRRLRVLVPTQ